VGFAAVLALVLVLIAACGSNAPTPESATATVAQPTAPAPTAVEVTPTPAAMEGKLDATVTAFEVWQDYMPVVPPDGAPLYGVVTVEITHTEKLTPQLVEGTVTLAQASGADIASDLAVTMQQQADDLGMQTPGPQTVTFTFGPGTTQVTLVEGELIGGALSLELAGEKLKLALPEVALYFTH
jgi:hypothetical protein